MLVCIYIISHHRKRKAPDFEYRNVSCRSQILHMLFSQCICRVLHIKLLILMGIISVFQSKVHYCIGTLGLKEYNKYFQFEFTPQEGLFYFSLFILTGLSNTVLKINKFNMVDVSSPQQTIPNMPYCRAHNVNLCNI